MKKEDFERPKVKATATSFPVRHGLSLPALEGKILLVDAAKALGLSPCTLRNYVKAGKLHAIRTSPKTTWLDSREVIALVQAVNVEPIEEN